MISPGLSWGSSTTLILISPGPANDNLTSSWQSSSPPSSWSHLDSQDGGGRIFLFTMKPHLNRSWVTEPHVYVHYETVRLAVWTTEKLDPWIRFACWPFDLDSAFPGFLAGVFHSGSRKGLGTFPILGLLEFSQLAYLPYWHLSIQELPRPSLLPYKLCGNCVQLGKWEPVWPSGNYALGW